MNGPLLAVAVLCALTAVLNLCVARMNELTRRKIMQAWNTEDE